MKFAFEFPFALPAGTSIADVLTRSVPSSGTVNAARLAVDLAALGIESTIFDTSGAPPSPQRVAGVAIIRTAPSAEAGTILVLPPQTAMNTLRAVRSSAADRGAIVFWLHNNLAIDTIDEAFRIGLDRAVCVSSPAAAVYDAYPWWSRIEAIPLTLRERVPADGPSPEPARVAFIGATNESKGFHHLLAAWPNVVERVPEAELHVFGSTGLHRPDAPTGTTGVMTPEFEQKYWRSLSGIHLRGSVGREELFAELKKTRVAVVNPNVTGSTETFCLSAVEAQACGVPVVGGAAQGLFETVDDGRSGILVSDELQLGDAIVRLIREDDLWRRLSDGARKQAAKFTNPHVEAERWIAMAERIADHRRTDRRRSNIGKLKGISGFGRLKIALKRRLRPNAELAG
jgi:glycosyltransferase involved in cell wall biosynthesis